MSDTNFGRMTINEVNDRASISDVEFKDLPGAVKSYIQAHVESGGNWERDAFRGVYKNRCVAGLADSTTIDFMGRPIKVTYERVRGSGARISDNPPRRRNWQDRF